MDVTAYESYAAWFNSIVDILPQNPELLPATVKFIPIENASEANAYQSVFDQYQLEISKADSMGRLILNISAEPDEDSGVVFLKQNEVFPMSEFYRDLWSQVGENQFTLTLNPLKAQ